MTTLLILLSLMNAGDFEKAVLYLSGASCIEELAEDELEHFQSLSEHPVDLNRAGRGRLIATGLFSAYQVASLIDYRSSSGDVLSFAELGLIDGFSPELASALEPFVLIRSGSPPGERPDMKLRQKVTAGAGIRTGPQMYHRFRYEAALGDRAEFFWTNRTSYTDSDLRIGTLSAAYYGERRLGRLVLGNFSARFGQGLAMWSGFTMSGYSSINSFRRNPGGIAATGSASSSLAGIASEWNLGPLNVSAAYSFIGGHCIFNAGWTGRGVTLGATATESSAAVDWRIPLPDLSLFGEVCADYGAGLNAVCGFLWIPEYGRRIAMRARWYNPSRKEYSGVAVGAEFRNWLASADAAYRNDKGTARYTLLFQAMPEFSAWGMTLAPKLRINGRLTPSASYPLRLDIRGDFRASRGGWAAEGRFNAVWCRQYAWLWYLQLSRTGGRFSVSARGSLFRIDYWDDRIYVYQPDAPGNFNVPAFYGRGWDLSAYCAVHLGRHHSVYLRIETVDYPWNLAAKAGRTELRLQYCWKG